jgi:hypothetical protein
VRENDRKKTDIENPTPKTCGKSCAQNATHVFKVSELTSSRQGAADSLKLRNTCQVTVALNALCWK